MHFSELSSNQQDYLGGPVVGPIYCKLVIEADDGDITLDNDVMRVSPISLRKRIDLDENMEQFTASELRIDLINSSNKFDRENEDSIFAVFRTVLLTDVAHTDTTLEIPKLDSPPLGLANISDLVGYYFRYGDGKVNRMGLITGITALSESHQISFTPVDYASSSAYAYTVANGNYLEIQQLVGRLATLQYVLPGVTEVITAFKGIITGVPDLRGNGSAELVVQDAFSLLLSTQLDANYSAVKEYQRTGSSTGTLSIDENNVGYQCDIGEWEIEITADNGSYYSFTVTFPDGSTKTGRTDQNFYSDANDYSNYSALVIIAADWSGSFDVGDVIVVETYWKQLESTHLIEALQDIVYGCLGSDLATDYNELIYDIKPRLNDMNPTAVFKKQVTCMQAAASLCQHLNITMFQGSDGKIHYFLLQPDLDDSPPVINKRTELMDVPVIEHKTRVRGVKILYNYDWDTESFGNELVWPRNWRGETIEMKLGFFTTESQAAFQAQYYLAMHEKGLRIIHLREKFNFGIGFDLSDRFQINSLIPELQNSLILLYEFTKDKDNGVVDAKGLDVNFVFGDFAFCDIDYCDSEKVVW